MKTHPIVYLATNMETGEKYVGATILALKRRKQGHAHDAKRGKKGGKFLDAVRKYGIDAFDFSVLVECETRDEALRLEQVFIANIKPTYNITLGGLGALGSPGFWLGKKRYPETVEKVRAALLANPTRYWLGKKRSQETREKISATKRLQPQVATDRVTQARKKNIMKAVERQRKWIICLNDGARYLGAQAAADTYGLKATSINNVCTGRGGSSLHGYKFQYDEAVS
jgi:group I intron endonuclease